MTEYLKETFSSNWLMGLLGAIVTVVFGFILHNASERVSKLQDDLSMISSTVSAMNVRVMQLDGIAKDVRDEQLQRTGRFSEITAKITGVENNVKIIENSMKLVDDRYKTISERILRLNSRLDQLKVPPEPKEPSDGWRRFWD